MHRGTWGKGERAEDHQGWEGKGRVVFEEVQHSEGADTGGQGGRQAHRRHPELWKVVGGGGRQTGWRAAPTRALRAARAAAPSLAAGESGRPSSWSPVPPQ